MRYLLFLLVPTMCSAETITLSETKRFDWGYEFGGPKPIHLDFYYGEKFTGWSQLVVPGLENVVDVGNTTTITEVNSDEFGLPWSFVEQAFRDTRLGHTPWSLFIGKDQRWKVDHVKAIKVTLDEWFVHPIKSWRVWTQSVTFEGRAVPLPEPAALPVLFSTVFWRTRRRYRDHRPLF